MIDETMLEDALHRAAETFEPPADGPAQVLDAARNGAARTAEDRTPIAALRPRRWAMIGVAATVVAVLGGVMLVQDADPGSAPSVAEGRDQSGAVGDRDDSGSALDFGSAPGKAVGGSGAATGGGVPLGAKPVPQPAAPATGSGGGQGAPLAPPVAAPARDSARIVKTGAIDVEVKASRFDAAVAQLESIATTLRGYVAKTHTGVSDDEPSGSVTLRVPTASFEQAVGAVRKLGDVQGVQIQAADVTAEFTDNEARLRALQATRARFETLLGEARNVGELLAVQGRITDVQAQIEQVQGRLKLLDDQASYAALTVNLNTPSSILVSPEEDRSRFAQAWDDAVDGFLGGLAALLRASGPALLVLICLAAAFAVARLGWRRFRRQLV